MLNPHTLFRRTNISAVYKDMDCSFEPFPKPGSPRDLDAWKGAIDALPGGSAITIFTPDSTHHEQMMYAIARGIHVLVTKPVTQRLEHHLEVLREAEKAGVYV